MRFIKGPLPWILVISDKNCRTEDVLSVLQRYRGIPIWAAVKLTQFQVNSAARCVFEFLIFALRANIRSVLKNANQKIKFRKLSSPLKQIQACVKIFTSLRDKVTTNTITSISALITCCAFCVLDMDNMIMIDAVTMCRSAIHLCPGMIAAHRCLTLISERNSVESSVKEGDHDLHNSVISPHEGYSAVMQRGEHSNNPNFLFAYAMVASDRGEFRETIQALQLGIELDCLNSDALEVLSLLQYIYGDSNKQRLNKSIELLNQSTNLRKETYLQHEIWKVQMYLDVSMYEKALESLDIVFSCSSDIGTTNYVIMLQAQIYSSICRFALIFKHSFAEFYNSKSSTSQQSTYSDEIFEKHAVDVAETTRNVERIFNVVIDSNNEEYSKQADIIEDLSYKDHLMISGSLYNIKLASLMPHGSMKYSQLKTLSATLKRYLTSRGKDPVSNMSATLHYIIGWVYELVGDLESAETSYCEVHLNIQETKFLSSLCTLKSYIEDVKSTLLANDKHHKNPNELSDIYTLADFDIGTDSTYSRQVQDKRIKIHIDLLNHINQHISTETREHSKLSVYGSKYVMLDPNWIEHYRKCFGKCDDWKWLYINSFQLK